MRRSYYRVQFKAAGTRTWKDCLWGVNGSTSHIELTLAQARAGKKAAHDFEIENKIYKGKYRVVRITEITEAMY